METKRILRVIVVAAFFYCGYTVLTLNENVVKTDKHINGFISGNEEVAKAFQVEPANDSLIARKKLRNSISYAIVLAENNTYGYEIFVNGKKIINQLSIPCIPGNNGFSTIEKAIKVSELVVNKIQKGEMPPSVTVGELKKLEAL